MEQELPVFEAEHEFASAAPKQKRTPQKSLVDSLFILLFEVHTELSKFCVPLSVRRTRALLEFARRAVPASTGLNKRFACSRREQATAARLGTALFLGY